MALTVILIGAFQSRRRRGKAASPLHLCPTANTDTTASHLVESTDVDATVTNSRFNTPIGNGISSRLTDYNTSARIEHSVEIDLALEEYRTVRQEEMVAMQSQISTLRYGVTGCVVLIGVAAQQHADRYLGWAISLALVPLVVLFSAVIWMGEYERMARAGHYIAGLERHINAIFTDGACRPMGWENWLREGGNAHSRVVGGHHRYLTITSLFIGFQIAAVAMGLHFYWHDHAHDPSRRWLIPLAVAINLGILLTLLGYFRSSYERLRAYTAEPEERNPPVRQRLRMRIRLYSILVAVGFISAPFYSWPLGIVGVRLLNDGGWLGHVPTFWIAFPTLFWMAFIPLVASRGVMRELLSRRILPEVPLDEAQDKALTDRGLLSQLTEWERAGLHFVQSQEVNAQSIGRKKHIVVTADNLGHEESFTGPLAHELGHHRLHHLHPLALSYLYLWPYLYYDERVARLATEPTRFKIVRVGRVLGRLLFSLAALPGWLAWVVLRLGWRTAEYDADRFACVSGNSEMLAVALRRHELLRQETRPSRWQDRISRGWERIAQGRALGYLPVPNEHPIPKRRLMRLKDWEWTQTAFISHSRETDHGSGTASLS
jgi:Zn-dependent protease with chaperone function